jgi:uncharacterized protein (TIGR02001 family)
MSGTRLLLARATLLGGLGLLSSECIAADVWGGSAGLTSDYMVRGISRSDDQAAVQADYHYLSTSGFLAGAFASTVRVVPAQGTGAELSAFLGYAWTADSEWRGKVLASHYAYARNQRDARYDYDELTADTVYQDWLDISVAYAPNYSRYVPYRGVIRESATSLEVNLQRPLYGKLQLTGGAGYSYQGDAGTGYVYWSVGASYDLAPVALGLSYVDTSAAAKSLFYEEAATGRWVATVIWRF